MAKPNALPKYAEYVFPTFMAMTFIVFALYGLFAAAMRDKVVSRPAVMAWLRRSFAAAFVAPGAKLVLTER